MQSCCRVVATTMVAWAAVAFVLIALGCQPAPDAALSFATFLPGRVPVPPNLPQIDYASTKLGERYKIDPRRIYEASYQRGWLMVLASINPAKLKYGESTIEAIPKPFIDEPRNESYTELGIQAGFAACRACIIEQIRRSHDPMTLGPLIIEARTQMCQERDRSGF